MQVGPIFAKMTSRSQLLRFFGGRVPGGKLRLPGEKKQGLHCTFGLEMERCYSITEIIWTPKNGKMLFLPKVQR
jgi:hypothetical protein